MKKFSLIFVVSAVLLAVSCVRESRPLSDTREEYSLTVPEGWILREFSICNDKDKTAIDGKTVSWTEGDRVMVYFTGGSSEGIVSNGRVRFAAPEETSQFHAVYPSGCQASISGDSMIVSVPLTVDGLFSSADCMTARSSAEQASFQFKHVCAMVRIGIPEGCCKVQMRHATADSDITVYDDGKVLPQTVYIPVAAGESWENGAGFRFILSDGSSCGVLATAPLSFQAGKMVDMGNAQDRIHDWYIKETACGAADGTSWENAGDATLLVKLLSRNFQKDGKTLSYKETNFWRIEGRTINISEGCYDISDPLENEQGIEGTIVIDGCSFPVSVSIVGGFSASDGTYDPLHNRTVLSSSAHCTSARLFNARGNFANWLFKGIAFDGLPATINGEGAVLNVESSAVFSVSKDDFGIRFQQCSFSDNASLVAMGLVRSACKNARITLDNCVFKNNTSSTGGIAIRSETAGSLITCNDCSFVSNDAGGNGGAINLIGGNMDLNRCVFEECSGGRGGAIYIENGLVKADHCSFNGNETSSSNGGGAIRVNSGAMMLNACRFRANRALSDYGTAINTPSAGSLGVFNSIFYGGHRTEGSFGGVLKLGSKKAVLACSTIVEGGIGTKATVGVYAPTNTSSSNTQLVAANLLLCTDAQGTTKYPAIGYSGTNYFKSGWNIFNYIHSSASRTLVSGADDLDLKTAYPLTPLGLTLDSDTGDCKWLGSVQGYTKPTKAALKAAVKANYADFDTWLTSIGAYDSDLYGNVRSDSAVWPGCYQGSDAPDPEPTGKSVLKFCATNACTPSSRRSKVGDGIRESFLWQNSYAAYGAMLRAIDADVFSIAELADSTAGRKKRQDGVIYDIPGMMGQEFGFIAYKNTAKSTGGGSTETYYSYANAIMYRKSVVEPLASGLFWSGTACPDYTVTVLDSSTGDKCNSCVWAKMRVKATGKVFWVIAMHPDTYGNLPAHPDHHLQFDNIFRYAYESIVPKGATSIILGDFNANSNCASYKANMLQGKYPWKDALTLAEEAGVLSDYEKANIGTQVDINTDGIRSEDYQISCWIDHIVLDGATVKSYHLCRDKFPTADGSEHCPSDHFPVIAELEL